MVKDPRFNSHWSLKDNRFMYLTSLFLSKWHLNNKCPLPWYHHSLYTGQGRYILLLYYPEFLELGTWTCKASASSMLREGDWSHSQDTTNYFEDIKSRKSPSILIKICQMLLFSKSFSVFISFSVLIKNPPCYPNTEKNV